MVLKFNKFGIFLGIMLKRLRRRDNVKEVLTEEQKFYQDREKIQSAINKIEKEFIKRGHLVKYKSPILAAADRVLLENYSHFMDRVKVHMFLVNDELKTDSDYNEILKKYPKPTPLEMDFFLGKIQDRITFSKSRHIADVFDGNINENDIANDIDRLITQHLMELGNPTVDHISLLTQD